MERGDGGKMTGNEKRTKRETGASAVERDTFNHPPYHGNKLKRLQRVLNVYLKHSYSCIFNVFNVPSSHFSVKMSALRRAAVWAGSRSLKTPLKMSSVMT